LRKAVENDARLIFEWANDDEVRNNAINTNKIKWQDHVNWFNKKLQSADTYMFIGFLKNKPVGQIRFDKEKGAYIIDYSIAKEYRGKGLGLFLIKNGIEILGNSINKPFTIIALVKQSNIASAKIFEKLHFARLEDITSGNVTFYKYKIVIN